MPMPAKRYDHTKIEPKWQKVWKKEKTYEPDLARAKKPFYNLMMFPYPSAEGLHVGNMYAFTGSDIYGRMKRMQGHDVFEPIGLDGFGIHSENYAIKIGAHPVTQAQVSEKRFYKQLEAIGNGFAWNEHLETYDPEYYKWTQWIFLQMWKRGLAYRKKQAVNWCPSCKTVLADEQVINGKCERCSSVVIKKELEQWFFKITEYANRLLKNLENLDWSEKVKIAQKNWIGKSEGAEIDFEIPSSVAPTYILLHGYEGSPTANFFPWLKKELERRGAKVYVPELPNTKDPRVAEQVELVLKKIPFDEDTVLVGHSLGGVVAMKVLERLKKPIRKTVLVGSYTENNFLDEDFPAHAFDWKFDFKKIKKNAGEVHIIRDLTDDTVPQYQPQKLHALLGGTLFDISAREPHVIAKEEPEVLRHCIDSIRVFTTRPDTLFGATYLVVSPEYATASGLATRAKNKIEVQAYIKTARAKSENDRIAEGKEKTGVELKGVKAINPANGEEISIWVADYVLGSYGTGAIMAVPAHDERDFEFAKKYNAPIKHVIAPYVVDEDYPPRKGKKTVPRKAVECYVRNPKNGKYLLIEWHTVDWRTVVTGGVESSESLIEAGTREVREETGYKNLRFVKFIGGPLRADFYHPPKDENREAEFHGLLFELENEAQDPIDKEESAKHSYVWRDGKDVLSFINKGRFFFERLLAAEDDIAYTGEGVLVDSGKFNNLISEVAKWEITKFVGGTRTTQYRLRDWLISRQRYWGPPIPMIHCPHCAEAGKGERADMPGWYSVPEKSLPVKLPFVKDFRPKGSDESPLASVRSFYEVKCPACGGTARRETDVSDTFLDSAWYYLRYLDTKNAKAPFAKARAEKWLPVEMYIGGAEHSVLHLLYVRFVAMMLHDAGFVNFDEPFITFRAHGLLIKEGAKMSKSKGNVVNPDEYIKKFGADALRMYLMFLAPFEQGGDFRDQGILGVTRFLERVWRFGANFAKGGEAFSEKQAPEMDRAVHRTIKKVTEDIESLHYNTAVSALMICLNELEAKRGFVRREDWETFITLLAPFAPHMTEELWRTLLAHKDSVHRARWPKYNERFLEENVFKLVIQINGKTRHIVEAPAGTSEDDAKKLALAEPRVQEFTKGKTPKRMIYVPGRLLNIVL